MNGSEITLQSELAEDWQLLQPILWMLLFFLAAVGFAMVVRNVIRMYKESRRNDTTL